MFKFSRTRPWSPSIDLSTVRKTVTYMQGDLSRVPGLEKIVAALETAIKEIDAVETRPRIVELTDLVTRSRFLPRKH
jgi:hypothetical protein